MACPRPRDRRSLRLSEERLKQTSGQSPKGSWGGSLPPAGPAFHPSPTPPTARAPLPAGRRSPCWAPSPWLALPSVFPALSRPLVRLPAARSSWLPWCVRPRWRLRHRSGRVPESVGRPGAYRLFRVGAPGARHYGPGEVAKLSGLSRKSIERYRYKGMRPQRSREEPLVQIAVEWARVRLFEGEVEVPRTDEAISIGI